MTIEANATTSDAPTRESPDAPDPERRFSASRIALIAGLAVLFAAIVITSVVLLPPIVTGAALLGISLIVLLRKILFTWTALLFLLAASIMFIPARMYALPIPLPFKLEAYRLMIFVAIFSVGIAFLMDRDRRWRPVAFGWPLGIFLATLLVSFIANGTRLVETGLATTSLSAFFQLGVLLSVWFTVRQVLTSERMVMFLLMMLAWSATIVAFFAIIERVARTNVFLMLSSFLPLVMLRDGGDAARAGVNRAYGSAQHPIALAVMLCMILPIIIYLAKYAVWPRHPMNRKIVYGIATVIIFGGIVAAISRTAVVVLGAMWLITLILRPKVALLLMAIAVPMLVIATAVVPAQVDSMLGIVPRRQHARRVAVPIGGNARGRTTGRPRAGPRRSRSRRRSSGRATAAASSSATTQNSFILDNQVLSVLLEGGALGVAGFAVFMLAPVVMLLVFAFRFAAQLRHASLAFSPRHRDRRLQRVALLLRRVRVLPVVPRPYDAARARRLGLHRGAAQDRLRPRAPWRSSAVERVSAT